MHVRNQHLHQDIHLHMRILLYLFIKWEMFYVDFTCSLYYGGSQPKVYTVTWKFYFCVKGMLTSIWTFICTVVKRKGKKNWHILPTGMLAKEKTQAKQKMFWNISIFKRCYCYLHPILIPRTVDGKVDLLLHSFNQWTS